jgi:uncharacterized protein
MKISLAHLSEGLHTLNFVEKLAEFGLENQLNLHDEVKIQVDLEKRVPHYFLKNRVQVTGRFACDRCANEFDRSLTGESRVVFSSDEAILAMSEADDVHYLAPDAKEINIANEIRDTIMLAMPMKILCSEDCRGLCAGCGANLNIEPCRCAPPPADPRWEALRKFL